MKNWSLFLVTSLAALTLVGCNSEESAQKQLVVQAIDVDVQTVDLGTIALKSIVAGSVVPDQQAQISSRLMGFIKNFDVKVGQEVKAGDLLFSIDASDVKSNILKAESGYQQAKAALMDAKLDFNRFKKLYEEASVSKQQFDKMSLQYKVAQERMVAAKTGLLQAKSQLRYANVKAPFSGVVVKKMASAGDLSAPGSPVLLLENKRSLSVRTQVSHEIYAVLRVGDTAEILLDGQTQPVLGTIYTLVSAADPKSRTHTVKLSLTKLDNVNSGTYARIGFKRGERQTMVVPKSAVVNRSGIEGVFVVEDQTAFFHMVRLGETLEDKVEVKSGLNLGDKIVTSNNISLLNGDRVNTGENTVSDQANQAK